MDIIKKVLFLRQIYRKMRKFFNFIISKKFWLNALFVVLFFLVCFIILRISLNSYTRHGKTVTVPNVIGVDGDEAIALLDDEGYAFEILDTIFSEDVPKGAVAYQNPDPETQVKKGRIIYLKINSQADELIPIPDFTGFPIRQVASLINKSGFAIGDLRYIPDIATNVVLKQMYQGREIKAGTQIKKGSKIDLIIGMGQSDETTSVPWVIGMTYQDASNALIDSYLNIGAAIYKGCRNSKDSTYAKVYKQSPTGNARSVNFGTNVDIWLTLDEDLINQGFESMPKEKEESAEDFDDFNADDFNR